LDTIGSLISESNIEIKNPGIFNSNAYNLTSFKIGFNAFSENPDSALKAQKIKKEG
jgi:hypothetical protein